MSEEDVRQLCEPFGEVVDVKLITDFRTGRSKGFAFVEFADEAAAQAALAELNEKPIEGRNLFVTVARPKAPRREFGGDRGPRQGGRGGYNDRGFGGDRNYSRDRRGSY